MPRYARIKSKYSVYHIMVRSISEVFLFKEKSDKVEYISIIKKYQKFYGFKIYAYCLMDNHAHFIICSNGSDISKIMHSINFLYAQKFNHKYNRHGHLFQDRFKSKIINSERYLLALTAYIHNNPKDIRGYRDSPEEYEFSSSNIYLGAKKDRNRIVDLAYVNGLLNKNKFENRKIYRKLLKYEKGDLNNVQYEEDKFFHNNSKRKICNEININEIINKIANLIEIDQLKLKFKYIRNINEKRIFMVLLLRCVFDKKCKEICAVLGNVSIGRISMLTNQGIKLIDKDVYFENKFKKYCQLLNL